MFFIGGIMNEIGYKKKIKKDCIEYTLSWSNYILADKFTILKKFNEMTGLYAIFTLNKYNRLTPIFFGAAWYSGLRSMILKLYDADSDLTIPKSIYTMMENEKIYIKYMEIYLLDDFLKIFFKLKEQYKDAYIYTNGLEKPEKLDLKFIKLVDKETKTYHKSHQKPNI
jgi:hypothetical protein